MQALDQELDRLTVKACPALLGIFGAGSDTAGTLLVAAGDNPQRLRGEAAFAKLCGVSPVEASSGMTTRHRLNRGGDRHANEALYRIVMVRPPPSPTHDGLRLEEDRRRQVQAGDHPLLETLRRSRGLPGPHRGSGQGIFCRVTPVTRHWGRLEKPLDTDRRIESDREGPHIRPCSLRHILARMFERFTDRAR